MVSKTKDRKGIPLSRYFKDLNESDIESDDSDEEENDTTATSNSKEQPESEKDEGPEGEVEITRNADASSSNTNASQQTSPLNKKLPSARDCLGTKSNPSFLKLDEKKEIDWSHSSHTKLLDDNESDQIVDYKSNAVPPPTSYEPVTDPGIKVVDSEGRKRKSADEELEEKRTSCKAYRIEGGVQQSEKDAS